ncbi:hypothetical protein BJ742DRAFT_773344 [Cladochytrium replicatum]|nr:hypothetical protein BJ742DRAFT_773344 [Cladochytrium replicatum]
MNVERLSSRLESLVSSSAGRDELRSKLDSGLHLIELAGNQRVWMPEDQPLEVVVAQSQRLAGAIPTGLSQQSLVNTLIPNISKANLNSTLMTLSGFFNRYYTSTYGVQSAQWLYI